MKKYRNKEYITLDDYIGQGGTALSDLSLWTIGGVSASDLIIDAFGDRYIAIPFAGTLQQFNNKFARRIDITLASMQDVEDLYNSILAQQSGNTTTTTTELKHAPLGGVDFASAYSDGGTIQKTNGDSRLTPEEFADSIRFIQEYILCEFDRLFMPIDGWGCEQCP